MLLGAPAQALDPMTKTHEPSRNLFRYGIPWRKSAERDTHVTLADLVQKASRHLSDTVASLASSSGLNTGWGAQ